MRAFCRHAAAGPDSEQDATLEADPRLGRGEDVRQAAARAGLEPLAAQRVDEPLGNDPGRWAVDREQRDQLARLARKHALVADDVDRGRAELRVDLHTGI